MDLKHQHPFNSTHIPPRNVDIWLPPGYGQDSGQRYPVIYMHDGQNLFDPALSFSGVDWGIDPSLRKLLAAGEISPPIVVGIWNTANRLGEYMPEAPLASPEARIKVEKFLEQYRRDFPYKQAGDVYLAFIVEELKPWVDVEFRTLQDQLNTHIAGSSMGGLISLYAVCRYPEVFCGAGCLSTAWHVGQGVPLPWFEENLPDPKDHKLYFDMGGREDVWPKANHTLLRMQSEVDEYARRAGYRDDDTLLTLVFPKHRHHESAWRKRVDGVFRFFLT